MRNKSNQINDVRMDLEEAIELIEISRDLFQKKLSELQEETGQILKVTDKKKLEIKALMLYEDYKKSLAAIEEYIDELSLSVN